MNGPRVYLFMGLVSHSGYFSISLHRLTNHGVNFTSLRRLNNHDVNFMSSRGLTNHGIDATDSQKTIYVKTCHVLMASSLQFKDLLNERDQYRSQGSSTDKLFH